MLKKLLPLTLLAMAGTASADAYLGGGVGQSSMDVQPVDLGAGVSTSVTDTDNATKLFGGFEFNRSLALEVGFIHFGEHGVDYADSFGTVYERVETTATTLALIGALPLGPGASLYGKVGFASWYQDYSVSDFDVSYLDDAVGVDPMFGVGVQIDAGPISLRAEGERYMDVGDVNTIGKSDIDVVSVNALFWF
jgi:OOP family OmpA-OmpF porin